MTRRGLVLAVTALALALTGCRSGTSPDGEGALSDPSPELGHIHGLGVNPADDRLYVAAHSGVFRQTGSGFERIAERWQDTMAFTVVGADTFLAGGHPDLRESDNHVQLGLIESTDAGGSWQPLSLRGRADFHALEPAGALVYGYDSAAGRLKVTEDRREWRDLARLELIDLAVNPEDDSELLVTTGPGTLTRLDGDDGDGDQRPLRNAPRLAYIDWPRADLLVGVAPDGTTYRSEDGGLTWTRLSSVGSAPGALEVATDTWYVGTERGVLASDDDGLTWKNLVEKEDV